MSFFDRNRRNLEKRGIDPDRLPPGQYHTERFPVLHAGSVPTVDLAAWDFTIDGLVDEPVRWTWEEMQSMPRTDIETDIHCVTKWSKFDTTWAGVSVRDVWGAINPAQEATHVMVTAEGGYTANLPVEDFLASPNLFADTFNGEALDPEHGYPMRLVVPHLYFWKSAKWVRGFTLLSEDEPGFWEKGGYHMYGDPFLEQRYWND
jgi:DMSO/TMAO reductase YedYZ molybdopterin-dependent catalytic subunit